MSIHNSVNEKGIKYTDYLKYVIPNFKEVLADLLISIIEEQHNKSFSFKIIFTTEPTNLSNQEKSTTFIPEQIDFTEEMRLTCNGEIRTIKYLRRYLEYIMSDVHKFSIKLNYVGTHSRKLKDDSIVGFHIYEIKLK